MKNIGEIIFEIKGKRGNVSLTPDNYDVFSLPQIVEDVKDMLFPEGKDKGRPIVTYEMRKGSVKHVFKTQMQKVVEFGAVLSMISATSSLDGLVANTAKAFEDMQLMCRKKGLAFNIFTSATPEISVHITPETNFSRTSQPWADAEFYFYGKLIDAGGKEKANIHLVTEDYGTLMIDVDKDYLRSIKGNPLYRNFAVRVVGKQNIFTGEMNTSSFKLVEITDYDSKFDEEYLNGLIKKSASVWSEVDVDEYINEVRGETAYV